jgi:hypothetical protein
MGCIESSFPLPDGHQIGAFGKAGVVVWSLASFTWTSRSKTKFFSHADHSEVIFHDLACLRGVWFYLKVWRLRKISLVFYYLEIQFLAVFTSRSWWMWLTIGSLMLLNILLSRWYISACVLPSPLQHTLNFVSHSELQVFILPDNFMTSGSGALYERWR